MNIIEILGGFSDWLEQSLRLLTARIPWNQNGIKNTLRQTAELRILYGICLLLAGCGGMGQQSTVQPPLTLSPPPTAVIGGMCEVTADLENWLQFVEFSRREFQDLVTDAGSKSRQRLYADVERMGQILINLSVMPAPDCAASAQRMLIDTMMATTFDFQHFINGERDDLRDLVSKSRQNLEASQTALNILLERLSIQHQSSSGQ